jgi:hypothetical protein
MSYAGAINRYQGHVGAAQGYFKPGMTEAQQRAAATSLTGLERQQLLSAALAELQSIKCWSQDAQNCSELKGSLPGVDCQTLADGWIGDYDQMQAAVDAIPYCPAPARRLWPWLLIGAVPAVMIGLIMVGNMGATPVRANPWLGRQSDWAVRYFVRAPGIRGDWASPGSFQGRRVATKAGFATRKDAVAWWRAHRRDPGVVGDHAQFVAYNRHTDEEQELRGY